MAETAVTAPAAGTGPQAPGATTTAPATEQFKPGEKVYTIKHPDGREEKRGESWILERAQKSIGLEKRVSDADKYETAFNNFVSKAQDPKQLFELLNHPEMRYDEGKQEALLTAMLATKKPHMIQAVKKWLYENEVKPSMMDPVDRERMEWKNKAEALEMEKQDREKQFKEQEEARNVSSIKEEYRQKLGEAYRASGLPVDDFLVRQVMDKARLYVRAGKHPDFINCCKLVQADFITQVKGVLGKATVDNILNYLDGETPQTINKALMKALDRKDEMPSDPNAPRNPTRKRGEKEKSPAEKKKWLRNLERGIID